MPNPEKAGRSRPEHAPKAKNSGNPTLAQAYAALLVGGAVVGGGSLARSYQDHLLTGSPAGVVAPEQCRRVIPAREITLSGTELQAAVGASGSERQALERAAIIDEIGHTPESQISLPWEVTALGPDRHQNEYNARQVAANIQQDLSLLPDDGLVTVRTTSGAPVAVTIYVSGAPSMSVCR